MVRRYPAKDGAGDRAVVDGIDLLIRQGEAVGLVGGSGAGKSTLARLLLLLERPDVGEVRFDGVRADRLGERRLRAVRRRLGVVFQDPDGSLNPRLRVGRIVAEPLLAHRIGDARQRAERVQEALAAVGLPGDAGDRRPHRLSGGERQRVAIARAVVARPDLLVLDEPVSSLDAPLRDEVVGLLARLRASIGAALLLIAHDLDVVGRVCERLAVLLSGRVVEEGPAAAVLAAPAHPYTALLRAASDPGWRPPDGATGPMPVAESGCRHHLVCPLARARCADEPSLAPHGDGRQVRCWFPLDG